MNNKQGQTAILSSIFSSNNTFVKSASENTRSFHEGEIDR